MAVVAISGNTYPVREQLRGIGGRWNAEQKAWMVPEAVAEQARKIVADAPAQEKRPYRPYKCRECGTRGDRYNPIYRSGVCRNCWRDKAEDY